MSRFGPSLAKSILTQQQRHVVSAVSLQSDPIQKIFLDKIKDFKNSNQGLDEKHKKMITEEMARLKRVYSVEDANKLARVDRNFPEETPISLHDLDTSKEIREKIYSGEYRKQIQAKEKPKSALLESIPYREPDEFHLPLINKPNKMLLIEGTSSGKMPPVKLSEPRPDSEIPTERVTLASLQREFRVVFGEKMPTIHDDKDPQRDLVNFPRQPQLLDTPPTVAHVIPASWFKFFYPKTGVTGPYVFGTGFISFLLSKEWLVVEHELAGGLSTAIVISILIKKYGPLLSSWARKGLDEKIENYENWRKGNMETLDEMKNLYKEELKKGDLLDGLYDARRQDVDVQVEIEYRKRLNVIYEDVKRRLNYLVAVADSKRQINQAYMVNWVISNVHSSISPKQEEEYLSTCIGGLRQLAQKNARLL